MSIAKPARQVETGRAPLPPGVSLDGTRARVDQIYDHLRLAIVSLWLHPGQVLNENLVATQLQVSRTPVRDAVRRLAREGLVDIFPQSGTFVAPIRVAEVLECQIVREALEIAVIRIAAQRATPAQIKMLRRLTEDQRDICASRDYDVFYRADEQFHKALSDCAGTPRIWSIINSGKAQLDRVRRLAMPEPGQLKRILAEHEAIVAAIAANDAEGAVGALQFHLDSVHSAIQALIDHHGEQFFDLTGVDLSPQIGAEAPNESPLAAATTPAG